MELQSTIASLSIGSHERPQTLLDLPVELVDLVYSFLSVKDLVVTTRVSRSYQRIALQKLERNLHTFLSRESQQTFLRVGWWSPMKFVQRPITWEYDQIQLLTDTKFPQGCSRSRSPKLDRIDSWYSSFRPGGSNDPWFHPGRIWLQEDELECCRANIHGCLEADDQWITEDVELEWNEDFAQFRLRLYLAEPDDPIGAHRFVDKMVRLHRDWLSQWDEKSRNVNHPDSYSPLDRLIWFDEKKTIGLSVVVWHKEFKGKNGADVYRVMLSKLWVRTLRLIEGDEIAKSSRMNQSKLTILATNIESPGMQRRTIL